MQQFNERAAAVRKQVVAAVPQWAGRARHLLTAAEDGTERVLQRAEQAWAARVAPHLAGRPTPAAAPTPAEPQPEEASRPAPTLSSPPPAVASLLVIVGPERGRSLDLVPGEHRLGRGGRCDLRLADDAALSREHALIRVHGRDCRLCDLASRNGTFLNGTLVTRGRLLRAGDQLRVGETTLLFQWA